ncbi:MAG TPA: N-6 DNA methylase [Herpetosiphonaceae bacterium]|nr:N-6 DNA methylase [Herpetosiphonaceae bacterium]
MTVDAVVVAQAIQHAAQDHISEATLRIRIEHILTDCLKQLGVNYNPIHEQQTVSRKGRTDALFGTVVIEYKRPNRLAQRAEATQAMAQLQGYLEAEAFRSGLTLDRYVGILMDGRQVGFLRHADGTWVVIDPEPISAPNAHRMLGYLRGLARKPLDPTHLVADFGPSSEVCRQGVVALWQSLGSMSDKTVMLYQEWQHLFGQVAGYTPEQFPELVEMERLYGITIGPNFARFLFTIHTYYALVIKLLAAELLTLVRRGLHDSFVRPAVHAAPEDLRQHMQHLEDGGIFRALNIENLLEGDFFSWYLDQWSPNIGSAVAAILGALYDYEPSTAVLAPERVKDLLKHLYQHLIPRTLRHDLGEFYTPDWLAGWLLDTVEFTGDHTTRLLDPACGSATFLVQAINRIRQRAAVEAIPSHEVLDAILRNVVGFDLNPLAVIAARTNYILALGDLLSAQRETIEIPIYLSDSIFSPSRHNTAQGAFCTYTIPTQRGPINVAIPGAIIDKNKLAPLLSEIEAAVLHPEVDAEDCLEHVARRLELTPEEVTAYGPSITDLYKQLAHLEAQNWDRIWARIIKNYFASAMVGEFDLIVGNPPWLRWTRLPSSYRETIKRYCVEYGLFSQDAYVGGIETDISTILTYSAAEKWLKPGGRLAFLITQTVFKSESSEGFRKFRLPDGTHLQVVAVHDLVEIKPFENAANRTAALILRKGAETSYPVPYVKWEKTRQIGIREHMTLERVLENTRRHDWRASPIYADGGPWLTTEAALLPAVRRMIGTSQFRARKGLTSDLNGVYWIEITGRLSDDDYN